MDLNPLVTDLDGDSVSHEPQRLEWKARKQMKYILLVHHDEAAFRKSSKNERRSMLLESVQLANQLHTTGHYLSAAPLHPTSETTCVSVRDNRRLVTDRPFAETREQIVGLLSSRSQRS